MAQERHKEEEENKKEQIAAQEQQEKVENNDVKQKRSTADLAVEHDNVSLRHIAQAAHRGTQAYGMTRMCIGGQGRAGKTSLTDAMMGKSFQQNQSTIGIEETVCSISYTSVGDGAGVLLDICTRSS